MSNNTSSGGIGFLSLLVLIFIVLKLTDNIAWSWWWVLCPLWAPFGVFLIVFGGLYLFALIKVSFFSTPKQKEQMKRIADEQKKNAGKSKWQIRIEQMQDAQKLRSK